MTYRDSEKKQKRLLLSLKIEAINRELANRRLGEFIKYNFPQYEEAHFHTKVIEALEGVERGDIKRLMIFMPPRHGKSEIGSIQFPAWYLGKHPEKSIITSSYSADLALDFGRKTRNLVNSREYQNVFDTKLAEDSQSAGRWNTDKGGAYIATGVGGSITGRGADILLIDDPVKNRQDAESEVIQKSNWDWYRSTARTRLSPDGAIIIIMTRWHDEDLAGQILKDAEDWFVVKFQAIDKNGEALWGSKFNLKILHDIKKDIGNYEWSALYQQEPLNEETQEFKQRMFKEIEFAEVLKKTTQNFITIDTAISKKSEADFTGIIRNYVDKDNNWYIKANHYKINPKELIDLIFSFYGQDHSRKIGIEKTIYADAIKPFLDDEKRRRNVFPNVVELEHRQTSKELRIRGLIPRYEAGSIYHIKGSCDELEQELLRFPKGSHDDLIDALAYQIQIAQPLIEETAVALPKFQKY